MRKIEELYKENAGKEIPFLGVVLTVCGYSTSNLLLIGAIKCNSTRGWSCLSSTDIIKTHSNHENGYLYLEKL
jgi:hypothetical protein